MIESPPEESEIVVVEDDAALAEVARACAHAEMIAVDVEADGLHAYRPKLCTIQLAWPDGEGLAIAIVDALRINLASLAPVLGAGGPIKVLHDLTFDARMLGEAGAAIARVRDTSVAARLLGFRATGLASLAESELGVTLDKHFQQHDWSRRPLTAPQIAYLSGDVRHLLTLDARLADLAREKGIEAEIADECAYKLETALLPPRDARPMYVRVKGAADLDAVGRAILRRLVEERERIAAAANVPPFKIVSAEGLLDLARRRPPTLAALREVRGFASGNAARHLFAWHRAIEAGQKDGDIPDEDRVHFERKRVDRAVAAERRARETQVTTWRREEAVRRGVDEQAVLPGHCAQALVDRLVLGAADEPALRTAIAEIAGMGTARRARYEEAWMVLARTPPQPPAPSVLVEAAPAAAEPPSPREPAA